jgi:hypothetical protein
MLTHSNSISPTFEVVFLALQALVVVFLLFHDWISLGHFNNLAAIRSQTTFPQRLFGTLLAGLPAAVGLYFCAKFFGRPYPHWLQMELWITYGLFLLGLLQAWWIPYLFLPNQQRVERYQIIFSGTHTFLPRRNGIAPDTLHTVFHIILVTTMVTLFLRERIFSAIS